ncbi:Uncharacterised protein [Klebsiella oxytoca]|nr:Uncharacterised protein [Klebsiella oxytoca]
MEFHENRARQPFIGFVFLARAFKKWWLREQNAQNIAAYERRTAKRCRAAPGSDQLKSAIYHPVPIHHPAKRKRGWWIFPEAALDAPVRATGPRGAVAPGA